MIFAVSASAQFDDLYFDDSDYEENVSYDEDYAYEDFDNASFDESEEYAYDEDEYDEYLTYRENDYDVDAYRYTNRLRNLRYSNFYASYGRSFGAFGNPFGFNNSFGAFGPTFGVTFGNPYAYGFNRADSVALDLVQ